MFLTSITCQIQVFNNKYQSEAQILKKFSSEAQILRPPMILVELVVLIVNSLINQLQMHFGTETIGLNSKGGLTFEWSL